MYVLINCNVLFSFVGIFVQRCVWNIYCFTLFIENFQVAVRLNFLDSFKHLIYLSLCFINKNKLNAYLMTNTPVSLDVSFSFFIPGKYLGSQV